MAEARHKAASTAAMLGTTREVSRYSSQNSNLPTIEARAAVSTTNQNRRGTRNNNPCQETLLNVPITAIHMFLEGENGYVLRPFINRKKA